MYDTSEPKPAKDKALCELEVLRSPYTSGFAQLFSDGIKKQNMHVMRHGLPASKCQKICNIAFT